MMMWMGAVMETMRWVAVGRTLYRFFETSPWRFPHHDKYSTYTHTLTSTRVPICTVSTRQNKYPGTS
jgi:hypothetical protein